MLVRRSRILRRQLTRILSASGYGLTIMQWLNHAIHSYANDVVGLR